MKLYQTNKLFYTEGNYQENEKATYWTGDLETIYNKGLGSKIHSKLTQLNIYIKKARLKVGKEIITDIY